MLEISKYSFVSKRVLNDSLPMRLYSLISISDDDAYISYRSLYSLTKTEIDTLLSDTSFLKTILDPKDLTKVTETLEAIRNSKAIIDDSYKDTPYIKRAQPEKLSPTSSDEPGNIIDNTPEAIKEAIDNSAYVDYLERRALRSNAESNYLKITQVSDPKYRQNKLMAKILKDLRLYATPNVSYTGSIMMQNMNYHENMIAFKHNIVNYAKAFNNLYPDIKEAATKVLEEYNEVIAEIEQNHADDAAAGKAPEIFPFHPQQIPAKHAQRAKHADDGQQRAAFHNLHGFQAAFIEVTNENAQRRPAASRQDHQTGRQLFHRNTLFLTDSIIAQSDKKSSKNSGRVSPAAAIYHSFFSFLSFC